MISGIGGRQARFYAAGERVRAFATAFRLSKHEERNGGENTDCPVNGGGSDHD